MLEPHPDAAREGGGEDEEALAALLADVAGAADLEEAGRRLAVGLAALAGGRGVEARVLALDEDGAAFVPIGATSAEAAGRRLPVAGTTHPVALAGLGLVAVAVPDGGGTALALPLPQPLVVDGPASALAPAVVQARLDAAARVVDDETAPDRRLALAPFGVALVGGTMDGGVDAAAAPDRIAALTRAAVLAGPILARHARHVRRGGTLARRAADTRVERAKNEFLASVSHELRTPIHAILGYASLLLDEVYGAMPPRQREKVERIHGAAEQLLAIVSDMLDVARIEAGRLPVRLERTPLVEVLRAVATEAGLAARAKGLTFTLDVAPGVAEVCTDPSRLQQLLGHLLANAVKFTATGEVTLRAVPDGERVRVDVVDTGIGIPASQLDAIWEDFHQVDQSRTREHGGTGLGLGIVRRLAATLGTEIRTVSAPGAGTTVSVWVPLRAATPPGAAPSPPDGGGAGADGVRER